MTLSDLKDYKLVWSDEFDGNELDPKKWCFHNVMGRARKPDGSILYDLSEDERNVKVEDSLLKLNVYYDEERECFVGPSSPTTLTSMSYTYGYLEMRARVPYSHASWASFWAIGRDAINEDKSLPYFVEFDFFEIDGANHIAYPNLHKWHKRSSEFWIEGKPGNDSIGSHFWNSRANENSLLGGHIPDDPEGFNTYGVLWTPEKIEMFINGEIYCRFYINENFGRPSGMEGFHRPIFLIFNNYLMLEGVKGITENTKTSAATPESVASQVPYEIDYVRLYQKDGEGELNLAEQTKEV